MRVGSVEVGDEVGGGWNAPVSRLREVMCCGDVSRVGGDAGQCVESEYLDMGVVVELGVAAAASR